ncbi:type II toxin-antitoxin system RelE/ParE family toxin [Mesorhizobium sp. WSM2561]|uniref:type II toxin-antitoxin system RelE/ParE family toxin n=1 Tax=Mesorhizobium sp. WSM2561 TaxID=1040985 RepID=UPI0004894567|nr:type II toxin-antitoxin system RelE/ParE family toxin [Mesorhizobium sp. WSM2561]
MPDRVFKTAWFGRASRKARISDAALCKAVAQVAMGQAEDLGGGVFKKRLNDNRHRSIILASSGQLWVYEYLFAKQDRANIDDHELVEFRKLAKAYAGLTERQIAALLADSDILEICHEQG